MRDEKGLVERAKHGDPEAFAQLYEEYVDKIYRYISLRIGNQAEAEDLTQQVFLKALESISSYQFRGIPFTSWLFRIAHNQVIDYLRKAARIKNIPLDVSLTSSESDVAREVEEEFEAEQVKKAIGELTQLQQEVISLRFAGELSTAEVAKLMGKSEGAIKALQHSALVALRKKLLEGRDGKEI